MQWLINIIQEWVQAQGYLTACFVDRGNALDYDWKLGDFTTDNNWHDLDVWFAVPTNAKGILLECKIKTNIIGSNVQLRSNAYASSYNIAALIAQVAGVRVANNMIVAHAGDQLIEYRASNVIWADIFLTIRGYWL